MCPNKVQIWEIKCGSWCQEKCDLRGRESLDELGKEGSPPGKSRGKTQTVKIRVLSLSSGKIMPDQNLQALSDFLLKSVLIISCQVKHTF